MSKYCAESWDADAVTRFLHERGYEHLRVRRRGSLLTIESGPVEDPVKHARLRRDSVHLWTLEMATHTGRFETLARRRLRFGVARSSATRPELAAGITERI